MKKPILLAAVLAGAAITTPALADYRGGWEHREHRPWHEHRRDHDRGRDWARVVDVIPIRHIERVRHDERRCWQERRVQGGGAVDPGAGMIAGTIIGGVVGNQIGQGDGRKAATALGAIIGAAVGHDMARDAGGGYRVTTRRCEPTPVYEERARVVGYRVTYRYHGRLFTDRMDHDPGRWLLVSVNATPAE